MNPPYNSKRKFRAKPVPHDPSIPLTDAEREKYTRSGLNSCYWHLARGDKTRRELFLKLKAKEIPEEIIENVLDKLEGDSYVNDKRFTENFIRSKQEYSGLGKRALSFELKRKGIDSDIISEALSEIDSDTEYENAKKLAYSKLKSSKNLDHQKRVNRLVSMLARKGYDAGISFSVVKEVLQQEKDEQELDNEEYQ